MTFEAYEVVVDDSGSEARGRERQALSLGIDRLSGSRGGASASKIWSRACSTCGGCGRSSSRISPIRRTHSPEKLRADIISIGLWVVKEADRLREEVERRDAAHRNQPPDPRRALMKISLRAGERIYINGAVLRVDRKVSLELVNDVMFLLESHVIQADRRHDAAAAALFHRAAHADEPDGCRRRRALYSGSITRPCSRVCENREMLTGSSTIDELVGEDPLFRGAQADPGALSARRRDPGDLATSPPRSAFEAA